MQTLGVPYEKGYESIAQFDLDKQADDCSRFKSK
jgi:hypothetical protein